MINEDVLPIALLAHGSPTSEKDRAKPVEMVGRGRCTAQLLPYISRRGGMKARGHVGLSARGPRQLHTEDAPTMLHTHCELSG